MTDHQFLEKYNQFHGTSIDNINQIRIHKFNGKELKDFVSFCNTVGSNADGFIDWNR